MTDTRRIVFLSTGHPRGDVYPGGGGTQYEIQGLAECLALRGHEVHVIARRITPGELDSSAVYYHQVLPRGWDQILSVLDFGRHAVAHINDIDPDILYLTERFSAAFASRLTTRKIFALHNSDAVRAYWRFAIGYNPANLAIFPVKNRLEELIMRQCQHVIVPTKSWLSYLERISIASGVAISHGLHIDEYENKGDNGFLLCAGRLSYVKGIDVLLRAYARLDGQDYGNLILAGQGPDETEFRNMARKLGILERVRFLGHLPKRKLLPLYATCTALVLPSRWETFGIAASEGLASGKTVIATDIPGPRDFIEDGRNGLLFPSEDADALTQCLLEVFESDSLRRKLGTEARRRAVRIFDFNNVAIEHERLFSASS